MLVEELKQHKYLLGDDFTTLDIHLLINLEWADALDWLSGNQDEAVLRCYYEAVRSRAAYKNCWEIRKPLDLSQKLLNTFAPQDQAPPTDPEVGQCRAERTKCLKVHLELLSSHHPHLQTLSMSLLNSLKNMFDFGIPAESTDHFGWSLVL